MARTGEARTAVMRHETLHRAVSRSMWAIVAMAVMATISTIIAWVAITSQPEPRYFAAREDGSIIPLVAVDQPFLNDNEITNFSVEATTTALTMDFANWRDDLSQASEYFVRPEGWEAFLTAMEGSGVLDFIRENRLVSSAVANNAVITGSGANNDGVYSWEVQVPITINFQSASEQTSREYMAELIITRVPTWERSRGVAIQQIIVR